MKRALERNSVSPVCMSTISVSYTHLDVYKRQVYEYIIKDINPEISDDEARTITVDYILIKTYTCLLYTSRCV